MMAVIRDGSVRSPICQAYISLPASLIFHCLPGLYFIACQGYISLVASPIFHCLPAPYFIPCQGYISLPASLVVTNCGKILPQKETVVPDLRTLNIQKLY
jgi:hypothetical protein